MGYYTYYSMEARNIKDRNQFESMIEELKHDHIYDSEENYAVFCRSTYYDNSHNGYFEADDETKWYEHTYDMVKFSKKFPDVTFCLSGEGEERDDIWREYYHNGEAEECRAQIIFEKPQAIEWED